MKKRSPLLSVIVLIIFIGIIFFASPMLDRLFAPWAFEHDGRPGLPGFWIGQFTTDSGRSYGVFLELLLPEPKGRAGLARDWENSPYAEIGGTARLCDEQGQVHMYTIDGEPEDRQATRIVFYTSPTETPIPNGLTMSWVNGTWDAANSLMLMAQLYWEQDGSAISGPEYPDTLSEVSLPMTRGSADEFDALCAQIKK